jgi:hypothetical protein
VPDFAIYNLPFTISPGDSGTLKLQVDAAADVGRAKFWLDADPEPDWQVEKSLNSIYSQGLLSNPKQLRVDLFDDVSRTWHVDDLLIESETTPVPPTPNSVGYREMEILYDGTALINDQLAWGMGYGSDVPVFVRNQDSASQALHGLWQAGTTRYGIYKQATINRVAASIVDGSPQSKRGAKDDRKAVMITTYQPGFLPSQKVDFTSEVWGFNDVIPIRKMEVTFEAPNDPKFALVLSHEIDTPFGFVDPFSLSYSFPPFPAIPPFPVSQVDSCNCLCGVDRFARTVTDTTSWGQADNGGAFWDNGGGSTNALPNPSVVPGSAYLINTTDTITSGEEIYRQVLALADNCISDTVTVTVRWSASRAFVADLPFVSSGIGYVISSDTPPTTPVVNWKQYEALILGTQTANTAEGALSSIVGVSMGTGGAFWALANNGTPNPAYLAPLSFTFTPDDIYVIKVFIEPTQIRAKMWNENVSEPASWDFTKSTTDTSIPTHFRAIYRRGFHPLATGSSSIAGNTVALHSIEVSKCTPGAGVGDPCYRDCYSVHNDVVDAFGRTTVSGWNTSSSGGAWVKTAVAGSTIESVNGSAGLSQNGGGNNITDMTVPLPRPFDSAGYIEARWRVSTTSNQHLSGLYNSDSSHGFFWDIDDLDVLSYNRVGGGSQAILFTPPFDDSQFWIAVRADFTNTQVLAKAWLTTDPEPGFDPTSLPLGTMTPEEIVRCIYRNGGTSAPAGVFKMHEIDVIFTGCVDVTRTTSLPTDFSGFGCETPVRVSSTVYQCSSSMIAGSSRVYVNGLLQRPGIAREYTESTAATGTIVFNDPVSSSAKVLVCYYAAGPIGGGA